MRLCRAHWKNWDVVALGEADFLDFLDRLQRGGGGSGALSETADYKAVMAKAKGGASADAVSYVNLGKVWELYGAALATMSPGVKSPLGHLAFMHAAAGGISLRDAAVVRRSVILAPVAERGTWGAFYHPIPLDSLRYTTPSTVLYVAQSFGWEEFYDQQVETFRAMQGASANAANSFDFAEKAVKAQGLDLRENFLRALGSEMGMVADWPAGQAFPDVLLLVAVKDAAKFGPFYDKFSGMLAPLLAAAGQSEPFEAGAFHGLSLTPTQMPQISPTLFDGPAFWGLSLTGPGAKRLLAASPGALAPRTVSLSHALPGKPYCTFYMRTDELAGRGYTALKPFLAQALSTSKKGQVFAPQLPDALGAAPLLGDFRASGTSDGDFLYQGSESPDGGLGVVAGIGVALAPTALKLMETASAAAATAPAVPLSAPVPPPVPTPAVP